MTRRYEQPGPDLFGYDPAAAAAEFATAHQGGLAPMLLAGDYDGTPRNAVAHADTLGDTGQANAYMTQESPAAEVAVPVSPIEAAAVLGGAEYARQLLARRHGLAPTPVETRPLATGKTVFDIYAGK